MEDKYGRKIRKRRPSNRKKSVSLKDKSKTPQQQLFKDLMDAWIQNDLEIEKMNNYLKRLRERKTLLENKLIPYIKHNNLDKSYIVISNHKICMANESTYQNLSFKYINEQLENKLDKQQIDKICDILKEGRAKSTSIVLKRK